MDGKTASLFRNGRNQALRIPREFELPGSQVKISRLDDGRLVIEPTSGGGLLAALKGVPPLDPTDWMDPIEDLQVEPVDL